MWVVWLPFLLTPNHCPLSVTWEILGVETEDGMVMKIAGNEVHTLIN